MITATNPIRSRKPLCLRDSRFGCAASEGGAPFVARRAVNLHGCALPHCAPRSSYGGGTPGSVLVREWGAPPPAATPPDPPVAYAFRAAFRRYGIVDVGRPTTSFALLGYPHTRKNGGHSGGATKCSPVLFHREYPRERPLSGSGAAYGVRQRLRRTESQRAVEGRERSGVEAPPRARSLSIPRAHVAVFMKRST